MLDKKCSLPASKRKLLKIAYDMLIEVEELEYELYKKDIV